MSGPRKLNPIERGFVATMNTMTRVTQGYEVAFTEELVRQQGIGGFFKWAGATQGIWNEMVAMFGEPNAHLLASFASFWNGCDYCAYGHMLAYNLHHFEHEDALFAIDEREVPVLLRKRDGEILAIVKERLQAAGQERPLALLLRQAELRENPKSAATDEDRMLVRTLGLYEWVNECSITAEAPAPPLGPVAKKKALRVRYDSARAETRAAAPAPAEKLAASR